MTNETIQIDEIIGKKITDIRCKYGKEEGWLDTAECFMELNRTLYIDIPEGGPNYVFVVTPDADAKTIFNVAPERIMQTILNRVINVVVDYLVARKDKLNQVANSTIVDYLWESGSSEKGIFELDNGYFISWQYMAPHGTGRAGLHYYESLDSLTAARGTNLKRYSEWKKEGNGAS